MIEYKEIPQGVWQLDDYIIYQSVAQHIESLLGTNWYPLTNIDLINGIPECIKVAWHLWYFTAEVAGNGFSGYIGNSSVTCEEIQRIRSLLKVVNSTELASLLEDSIPLSKEYQPEFWNDPASVELEKIQPNPKWKNLTYLDERAMYLAANPLATCVARYLKFELTKQPPAKAGGFELRTGSPDTRRLNDASYGGSILNSSLGFGSK